jgi:drug/metabolite transporter (DMT)-like permease
MRAFALLPDSRPMSEKLPNPASNRSRRTTARAPLKPLDLGLFGASVFAWGFAWIAIHHQVGTVAPEVSVVWRFLMAAPLMFLLAAMRGERLHFGFGDHLIFLALGCVLFSTNFTLFYYAAERVNSGLLSVVFSLASVGNVGLGAVTLGAPVDRRVLAGGLLGAFGVAAMFYPEIAGTQFNVEVAFGLALSLLGTLCFCIGNMISARLQRRRLPVFASAAWGMLYGTGLLAVFAIIRGQAFAIEPTVSYVGGLLYLALIGSVLAFACYLTLLGRIGADRAGYATVMYPVVALTVSTFAEGYQWTWPAVIGLAAVLGGNLLVLRTPRRR